MNATKISIFVLYLKLLREYMVVLRWSTTWNTIEPDKGGGPDLILSGFVPWIFCGFLPHYIWNIILDFDGRFWRCTDESNAL